jgi:hypothetical protein
MGGACLERQGSAMVSTFFVREHPQHVVVSAMRKEPKFPLYYLQTVKVAFSEILL